MLVSDSMIKRNPKTVDMLESMAEARANMTVNYAWSHAKVTLARTANGFFVIEGSGNWAEGAQYEQYIFLNDEATYRFRESELFQNVDFRDGPYR